MLIHLLLVVYCAEVCVTQFQYPSTCAKPNTIQSVSGPVPPLPILPPTFQATLEVNLVDKEETMVATEYYDGLGNRAAIRLRKNNTDNFLLLDYNNDQTLTYKDGVCYVSDLSFDINQLLFGLKTGPNGISHMYSTPGALHFAKSNGLTYMGQTTVRGIKVDHWLSCLYWPLMGSNFTLDYYFTARNWTTPELSGQVPIRAEAKGIYARVHTGNFHHIYEYIDFSPHIQKGDLAFQTPLGVICPGRKQIKTMPTMPNRLSYREEIVSPMSQQVSYADVWYDYNRKLVRFDYRPVFYLKPYFTTGPVKEVHDYSTGLAYAIDKTLGNCSVTPIRQSTFDTKPILSNNSAWGDSPMYLEMKSPLQWMYADNTSVSYEGQRTVRGQLCDVFVSNNTKFRIPGYDPFYSTFVYYFLSESWESPGRSNAVPVKIDVTTQSWVDYQASYEYYEASDDEFPVDTFDVSTCFGDKSKKHFRIDFPVFFSDSQLLNKSGILRVLSDKVLSVTHLHDISLQNTELHVDARKMFFLGTFLNKPPAAIAYFQKIQSQLPLYNGDAHNTLPDEPACAEFCNDETMCNSFQFCKYNNWCGLSKQHSPHGIVLVPAVQNNCTLYSRTVRQKPFEIDFDLAWNLLENTVRSGQLRVNVTINGKKETLVASSVTGLAADGSVSTGGVGVPAGQPIPGESQIGRDMVG